MGRSHALAYHRIPGFEICGIVTRSAESRAALNREMGSEYPEFGDFHEALRVSKPDAVSVSTYPDTHAAYAEAVTSLSPSALEKKSASSGGMLTRLSSLHRKAALWDEYQQKYDSIRQHAEDDLMAFSGQTFVQAYENAARSAGGTP